MTLEKKLALFLSYYMDCIKFNPLYYIAVSFIRSVSCKKRAAIIDTCNFGWLSIWTHSLEKDRHVFPSSRQLDYRHFTETQSIGYFPGDFNWEQIKRRHRKQIGKPSNSGDSMHLLATLSVATSIAQACYWVSDSFSGIFVDLILAELLLQLLPIFWGLFLRLPNYCWNYPIPFQ